MDCVPNQSSDSADMDLELTPPPPRRGGGWVFWLLAPGLLLLPVGVAFFALSDLVQLPALPKCFNARQAPPTDQIYCAKQLASRHDTEHLRRAILLANEIAPNHPLRREGDRLIEVWTSEILRRAEEEFQKGNLQGAIDIAQEVPPRVPTYQQVRETIQAWEDLWATAEDLYQQGRLAIDQENWYDVLAVGRRLLQLDNRYWTTERYQALMTQLQTARDNQKKDPRKKNKIARSATATQSPETVEDFLTQWEREQEREDQARLQRARQYAQSGSVEGLQTAIAEAQQILYGTSSYDAAQQAIAQWREQAETLTDLPYLDRAQQLANQGDLQGAINEASNIGWGRALYGEARDRIDIWRDQVYQQEIEQRNAELERITGRPIVRPTVPPPSSTPPPLPDTPLPPLPEPSIAAPSYAPTVPVSNTSGSEP